MAKTFVIMVTNLLVGWSGGRPVPEVTAVNRDSLQRRIRLVLPFVLLVSPAWSKELHPEVTTVKVSVYNDVGLSRSLLADLEKVAARVFLQAGVNLEWLDCGRPSASDTQRAICTDSLFPTHLHLRLIGHPIHSEDVALRVALGVSYLAEDGVGFQADVFYERVMQLQYESQVDPAILLGIVSAHELGHLLLGTSSHSPTGLMRGNWRRNDLLLAVKNSLLFSDDQSDHMRAKLYEAYLDRNRSRLVLASHDDSQGLPGAAACFVYSRVYVRLSFANVSPAAYLMCSDVAHPSLPLRSVNGAEASFPID